MVSIIKPMATINGFPPLGIDGMAGGNPGPATGATNQEVPDFGKPPSFGSAGLGGSPPNFGAPGLGKRLGSEPRASGGAYKPWSPAVSPRTVIDSPSMKEVSTLGGWAKQVGEDFIMPIYGIPAMARAVWKGLQDTTGLGGGVGESPTSRISAIRQIWESFYDDPIATLKISGHTTKNLVKAVTEHYQDARGDYGFTSIANAFWKRPILVAQDILGILSLGGGAALKSASAIRKIAGLKGMPLTASGLRATLSKIDNPTLARAVIDKTRATLASSATARTIAKLEELGNGILRADRLGTKVVFPFHLTGKVLKKVESLPVIRDIEMALGVDPLARAFAKNNGTIRLDRLSQENETLKKSMFHMIPRNRLSKLYRVLEPYDVAVKSDWADIPGAWEAIQAYVDGNASFKASAQARGVDFASGPAVDEAFEMATLKKIVVHKRMDALGITKDIDDWEAAGFSSNKQAKLLENHPRHGDTQKLLNVDKNPITPDELAWAKSRKSLAIGLSQLTGAENLYRPWQEAVRFDPAEAIWAFFRPSDTDGKSWIAEMERFTGRALTERNPAIWQNRLARSRGELLANADVVRSSDKYAIVTTDGVSPGPDYKLRPDLLEKYVGTHQQHGNEIFMKHLIESKDPVTSAKAAYAELYAKIDDEMAEAIRKPKQVWLPKGIAASLEMELARPGGFVKMYDTVLDYWRELVLTWSPRFYVNNILGNSVLTMIYGVNPMSMRGWGYESMASEIERGFFQAERNAFERYGMSSVGGFVRKVKAGALSFGSFTDEVARRAVFEDAVAKVVAEKGNLDKIKALSSTERWAPMVAKLGTETRAAIQVVLDARKQSVELTARQNAAYRGLKDVGPHTPGAAGRQLFRDKEPYALPGGGPKGSFYATKGGRLKKLFREHGEGYTKSVDTLKDMNSKSDATAGLLARANADMEIYKRNYGELDTARYPRAILAEGAKYRLHTAESRRNEAAHGIRDSINDPRLDEARLRSVYEDELSPFIREEERINHGRRVVEYRHYRAEAEKFNDELVRHLDKLERDIKSDIDGFNADKAAYDRRSLTAIDDMIAHEKALTGKGSPELTPERIKLNEDRELTKLRFGTDLMATQERAKLIKKFEPFRADVEKAIEVTERFLGAYGRGTPLERKYIRRAIPFWTFMKTMHQLYFMMPFIRPKTTWLWHHAAQMAVDAMDDEGVPQELRNSMPTGFMYDGKAVFIRLAGINVFDSIAVSHFAGVPMPKGINPANNPFLSVAIRSMGGYDILENPTPLKSGQFSDNMGRVYDWDSDTGEAKRVAPSMGPLDSIARQIPQLAVVQDLLQGIGVKSWAWMGGPKTYVGPGGKTLNPRHWSWALSRAIGAPISSADPKSLRMKEIYTRHKLIKMAIADVRRKNDPDERKEALRILLDMLKHPQFKVLKS